MSAGGSRAPLWPEESAVADGLDPVAVTVDVDGVPMSALVASVAAPRAVIVALHGGAVTSSYYDSRTLPGLSLLRTGAALGFTVIALDRPGYGASARYGRGLGGADRGGQIDRMATVAERVDLGYAAIDALLAGRERGAGVFLMAHSMGCVLAIQLAADPRGAGLLGLEIAGIGLRPHSVARTFMASLTAGPAASGDGTAPSGVDRGNLHEILWTPPHLYPDGAEAALALSASPRYEGSDVRGLADAFPGLAARVRIPVRYSLGDHEQVWSNGPAALASIAALFTGSPRVVTAEPAQAGHNLSLGRSALAYHLSVLSFADECALGREFSRTANLAQLPKLANSASSDGD